MEDFRSSGSAVCRVTNPDWLEARREPVVQPECDEVREPADPEEDGVPRGDVARGLEAVEQLTRVDREENATYRSRRGADPHDGGQRALREHVGDAGEEVR